VGGLLLVAILVGYVQPLRSYRDARAEVSGSRADVGRLEAETARLEERLARTETDDFVVREARRLGLVRPGERLFIVTEVSE
jgi:cell division protein FtsB